MSHLAADVNGDADDHGRNSDACDEGDADRSSDQSPQLPQNLLLPAPRLLPPKRTARWTDGKKHRGRVEQEEKHVGQGKWEDGRRKHVEKDER